ncbi:DUF4126 domain-containing protein [Sphingomonas sp. BIUV-7]|uniref:DUF4126 domain-containing protein n=1 Tax=Sphingomonas natans TaxID=3063330 RepID=A0ABT8Y554_9SPHN|nr:DUF4126 domain-containing protein [Sphingomonas sp. BIUV-7]MDO6413453.1 DUF4126 domain-containing protein [Sphingomonas sp. BIUV-7]
MILILALLIGIVAGLRAMTAPAAVALAARFHAWPIEGSWLAFMGYRFTPWIFALAAAAELVTDQLPSTPSRKVPPQFGARIVMGALAGATIGATAGALWTGGVAGIVGAVIGTLGGAALRHALARAFGSDRPAALLEDAVALVGAFLIVSAV